MSERRLVIGVPSSHVVETIYGSFIVDLTVGEYDDVVARALPMENPSPLDYEIAGVIEAIVEAVCDIAG